MKVLFLFCILIFATSAYASPKNHTLDMELSVDGAGPFFPKLTIQEGKKGTVEYKTGSKKRFLEVVPTEGEMNGHKGILMKFEIGKILKDGSRKILSKPTLLAMEGEKSSIEVGDVGEKELVSLKVVATRKAM